MPRTTIKLTQNQRIEVISKQLLSSGEVSIEKLARKFKVTGMTIRRDLTLLESQGEIIRTHGGAAPAKRLNFEFAFRENQQRNLVQKQRIAKHAAKHIHQGDVIMLDTGTTTLEIARQIVDRQNLTVITTSLVIISELQFASGIEAVLLGGYLRAESPDLHGPLTESSIDLFKTDIAFMGADAIDRDGITYTDDLRVVNLDCKMAANAKKVIVVADSSKFNKTAMCRVLKPQDYDVIITDRKISLPIKQQLKRKQIKIETL